jgi:pimeloyl-ACP methyl ester carboxylesterase
MDSATVPVDDHDLEMAYRDEGTGDPVVLCHGIPTNSYLFFGQFDALADERRVVAADMVGSAGRRCTTASTVRSASRNSPSGG